MRARLSRAHYPVTVLGPGRRLGLWFQGCSIGCHGCIALDTWSAEAGTDVEVDTIAGWCEDLPAGAVDGVTISGGEPFDQPEALLAVLRALHDWRDRTGQDADLLCYTGRSTAAVQHRFPQILRLLDAVVTGPFVAAATPGPRWRGSANQELVPLTALGHERYDADIDAPAGTAKLQMVVEEGRVYYIGIPGPGQLERFETALASRGVVHQEVSWRS